MQTLDFRTTPLSDLRARFSTRLQFASDHAENTVRDILADVRQNGDKAVLHYTQQWDFPGASQLRVPNDAILAAAGRVQSTDLWPVLQTAAQRIRTFHQKQLRQSWMDASRPGEMLGQIIRPLRRVGVYVPGGTAAYPSTVLMAAIPALVAGVGEVTLATPPQSDTGLPPDATLAAAHLAGISEVYAMGGAQAVGAFAYGTESVAPVDKIVGPGNVYVNLAKRMVYGTVGIDMLAGPSEIAVLADEGANAVQAAADVLSQIEHDANSAALVVCTSYPWAEVFQNEMARQLSTLPRRAIAEKAWEQNGFVVVVENLHDAASVVNAFAPEHLHLVVRDPWSVLGTIENAGAILIGEYTSAPLGDYLAGPSHTLPTAGCARFASPLNVDDFVKKSSVLFFDQAVATPLNREAATFARFEGLEGHARAAESGLHNPQQNGYTKEQPKRETN